MEVFLTKYVLVCCTCPIIDTLLANREQDILVTSNNRKSRTLHRNVVVTDNCNTILERSSC